MSERRIKLCSNCNGTHTGDHPHVCPVCREALRKAGPTMDKDAPLRSRKAWWKGGSQHG